LDGGEQFLVALANGGKQNFPQGAFGSLANVHQHGYELVVFGVENGPDGCEFQSQRNDFGAEELRDCKHRLMASALKLKSQGNERMNIAEGTKAGEDYAHASLFQFNCAR
jgi:hypothetical protein